MTERTEKQIGIWAKHETEENSRSKKEKVRILNWRKGQNRGASHGAYRVCERNCGRGRNGCGKGKGA